MAFGTTNIDEIFTWVDESYAVNHEMRIQTGDSMYMGLGVAHCGYSKKKFNTKYST